MRFKGAVLEGGYQLEDVIAADAEFAAFRVRVLGDASLDVVAQFYTCEADTAQKQVAVWEMLRELQHPNLNTPLGAGQKEWDGRAAAYVVLNRTEERLSGALEERALRPAEAGELVSSLSAALKALHERGLVHGCLSPEHVLATENAILLSTECVRWAGTNQGVAAAKPKYIAPENGMQNTTPEADIWCLGATLFEALTRKECGPGCREEGARLPLPFGRIVQRCLEPEPRIRGQLSEITELSASGGMPVLPPLPPRQAVEQPRAAKISLPANRNWIYGALAVLVVVAIIAVARPRQHPDATAPKATAKTSWPTRTVSPDTTPRHPKRRVEKVSAPQPHESSASGTVWRVVLYTYAQKQDAEASAQRINEQHPGLHVQAFQPNGGSLYLVVSSAQADRDTAMELRRQALRMGLPKDVYVRNFRR